MVLEWQEVVLLQGPSGWDRGSFWLGQRGKYIGGLKEKEEGHRETSTRDQDRRRQIWQEIGQSLLQFIHLSEGSRSNHQEKFGGGNQCHGVL